MGTDVAGGSGSSGGPDAAGRVDGSGPVYTAAGPAYRLVWRPPVYVGRGLAAGLGGVAARTVVLAAAIILYGCAVVDLVGLSFFAAVQIIMGWVYLIGGACKAPRQHSEELRRNPFTV